MKKVLITQSNYLPWRGFFQLLDQCEVCVLYDCVQYTKRDWRNRNRILASNGLSWITIPVKVKGRYEQAIDETVVSDPCWQRSHLGVIRNAYRSSPFFDEFFPLLESLLNDTLGMKRLSEINRFTLGQFCEWMDVSLEWRDSREFDLSDEKSSRLLGICQELNASSYVSAPAARSYLDVDMFAQHGIDVRWANYGSLSSYSQFNTTDFQGEVSVIDLIFNHGMNSLRSFGEVYLE